MEEVGKGGFEDGVREATSVEEDLLCIQKRQEYRLAQCHHRHLWGFFFLSLIRAFITTARDDTRS